jgi:hypothetical protein
MSMDIFPASGYVIPATGEAFEKLGCMLGDYLTDYLSFQEEYPDESFDAFLEYLIVDCGHGECVFHAHLNHGYDMCIYLFSYDHSNGSGGDDLSSGLYFSFKMDDLFTMEKTPEGLAIEALGLFPEHQRWTV